MSTALAATSIGGLARPAHLDAAFGEGNIREKISIPSLTIAGKKFTMKVDGEAKILTKTDTDTGEQVNLQFVNVVVVDMNPNRSRTYFARAYVPGENQMPECYSSDGKKPDADVKTPCAATCAACPNSVKGSKISNGKELYACDTKKRLAVWPEAMLRNPALGIPPLQMILPITSIWDKTNPKNDSEGWFAWDNYVADIRAKGVKHTAEIITRIKFDNTEHPKLLFKAVRYLDDAEHAQFNEIAAVKSVMGTEDVTKLLYGKMYDPDAAVTPAEEEFEQASTDVAEKAKAAAAEKARMVAEAEAKAKAAAAEKARMAAEAAASEDDGFGGATAPAAKPVAAAKPKTAKVKTETAVPPSKPEAPVAEAAPSDDLAALAAEWDL